MFSLNTWILIVLGICGGIWCCWRYFPRERDHEAFFILNGYESDDSSNDIYERIPYHLGTQ